MKRKFIDMTYLYTVAVLSARNVASLYLPVDIKEAKKILFLCVNFYLLCPVLPSVALTFVIIRSLMFCVSR